MTSLSTNLFKAFDKILHFSAYTLLAVLFTLTQRGIFIPLSLVGILILSAIIEIIQYFIGRSLEWNDLVVNTYGLGSGFVLGGLIKWLHKYIQNTVSVLLSEKRTRKYKTGEKIFSQGSKAKYLYVVTKGEVLLYRTENKERKKLGNVKEGGVFGEMGLLTGSTRYASAIAGKQCAVFAMSHQDLFQESITKAQNPFILIIKALAIHLQRSNAREDEFKNIIIDQTQQYNQKILALKSREKRFRQKIQQLQLQLQKKDG